MSGNCALRKRESNGLFATIAAVNCKVGLTIVEARQILARLRAIGTVHEIYDALRKDLEGEGLHPPSRTRITRRERDDFSDVRLKRWTSDTRSVT